MVAAQALQRMHIPGSAKCCRSTVSDVPVLAGSRAHTRFQSKPGFSPVP